MGNAHETNPNIDLSARTFSELNSADQTIDLLNNQIGRRLGNGTSGKTMKEQAVGVLDELHNNGLYVAQKKDDSFTIVREKITKTQYNYMKSVFDKVDENGKFKE